MAPRHQRPLSDHLRRIASCEGGTVEDEDPFLEASFWFGFSSRISLCFASILRDNGTVSFFEL